MKRFAFAVLVVSICITISCMTAFASELFCFMPVSQVPLYREAVADPYALNTSFRILFATDPEERPNRVYSIITDRDTSTGDCHVFYDYLNYNDDALKESNNKYIHMKTGASVGLMRVRFGGYGWIPPIDAELNIGGYINTVFCLFGKNDALDFDGSYFAGGSLRIADMLSFRFGIHHFSGHYGDELLEKYFSYNRVNAGDRFNGGSAFQYPNGVPGHEYYLIGPVEYVRDNSWIMGLSADVPIASRFSVRVYGEAELPRDPSWLRPLAHVPADYRNMVKEDGRPTLIDRIGGDSIDGEQFPQSQLNQEQELKRTADGSYKAWRIHTGLEVRFNTGFGAFFLAGDVQFHQDGKTLHKVGGYSNDNPWEKEFTIGGGLELGDATSDGKTVRLEVYYHDGRTPATQWFYQRMKCFSVGFGLN